MMERHSRISSTPSKRAMAPSLTRDSELCRCLAGRPPGAGQEDRWSVVDLFEPPPPELSIPVSPEWLASSLDSFG